MGEESDSNFYVYLVFAFLGFIGFLIHKMKAKKIKAELANFANTNSYIYHEKLNSNKAKLLDLPKFYANSNIYNYIEYPDEHWLNIWGDCERIVIKREVSSSSYSSFFLFIFNSIKLPEFDIKDNNGIIDGLANALTGKAIKLDTEFNSSYHISGTDEKQVTKFFTNKIKKAFLSMDKNNLPSERNLDISDLGNVITLQFNKIGVNFFGRGNKLFVFCSEQKSLFNRQKMFKLASGIANAIVKEFGEQTSKTTSNYAEEPQDEISQYLNSQVKNNSPSPKPNKNSNQINQPTINNQITSNQSIEENIAPNSNDYPNLQTANSSENVEEISPADQLLWLSAMMIIDKDIHRNELKNIVEYGINLGLSKTEIEQIINLAKTQSNSLLHKLKISNLPRSEKLMRMLIRVAFADGKIAPQELEFIRFAAQKMNFQENELKSILAEEKNNFNK